MCLFWFTFLHSHFFGQLCLYVLRLPCFFSLLLLTCNICDFERWCHKSCDHRCLIELAPKCARLRNKGPFSTLSFAGAFVFTYAFFVFYLAFCFSVVHGFFSFSFLLSVVDRRRPGSHGGVLQSRRSRRTLSCKQAAWLQQLAHSHSLPRLTCSVLVIRSSTAIIIGPSHVTSDQDEGGSACFEACANHNPQLVDDGSECRSTGAPLVCSVSADLEVDAHGCGPGDCAGAGREE